jgi:uncharacterized protein (TIGR02246 family)
MGRLGSTFVTAGSPWGSRVRFHGRLWTMLLLLSLPGCAGGTPPEPAASDVQGAEERIREVLRTWLNSQIRGEPEALGEIYAEDAVAMPPGRPPLSGREAILSDIRQTLAEAELQLSYTSDSRLIREDLSVERGRLVRAVHPRTGGPPAAESLNLVTVMVRGPDGRWRIRWQVWNSNLPAASPR